MRQQSAHGRVATIENSRIGPEQGEVDFREATGSFGGNEGVLYTLVVVVIIGAQTFIKNHGFLKMRAFYDM